MVGPGCAAAELRLPQSATACKVGSRPFSDARLLPRIRRRGIVARCCCGRARLKPAARRIRFRLPDQTDLPCPVPRVKILFFHFSEFRGCLPPSRLDRRGTFRGRHERWRRGAVACRRAARWNRERTNATGRTMKSYGPGAPMLALSRSVMIRMATVATSPDTGEITYKS